MDAGIQLRIRDMFFSGNVVQVHVLTTISNVKQWKATQVEITLYYQINDLKCRF